MFHIYRRHVKACPHRREGRLFLRCCCPIRVDGRLAGMRLDKSLGTTNWQEAQRRVRDLEANSLIPNEDKQNEQITVEQAIARFIADLEARNLRPSTLRKYRRLENNWKSS